MAAGLRITVATALLAIPVACHVKLYYEPTELAVRNARGATSDGQFSVNGACGGSSTYGANGVAQLVNGATLTVKINYNGGHSSNANNFKAAYRCGAPGDENLLSSGEFDLGAGDCTVGGQCQGGNYPCEAPNGQSNTDDAYQLTCTLPKDAQRGTDLAPGESADCTLSILDQRDWGGCIDIQAIEPAAAEDDDDDDDKKKKEDDDLSYSYDAPVQTETIGGEDDDAATPEALVSTLPGEYAFVESYGGGDHGGDEECPYCGVVSGGATIEYEEDRDRATVEYDFAGLCGSKSVSPDTEFEWSGTVWLTREDTESKQFKGEADFGDPEPKIKFDPDVLSYSYQFGNTLVAPFQFTLGIDGVLTIENIGTTLPEICDLVAVNPNAGRRKSGGGGGGGGGGEDDSGAATVIIILVIVVLVICVFGFLYTKWSEKSNAAALTKGMPNSSGGGGKRQSAALSFSKMNFSGGAGVQSSSTAAPAAAPGTWDAVKDEASGDTYWWNTVTGETTWDQPPGAPAALV